jgi:hypothetical protein
MAAAGARVGFTLHHTGKYAAVARQRVHGTGREVTQDNPQTIAMEAGRHGITEFRADRGLNRSPPGSNCPASLYGED